MARYRNLGAIVRTKDALARTHFGSPDVQVTLDQTFALTQHMTPEDMSVDITVPATNGGAEGFRSGRGRAYA